MRRLSNGTLIVAVILLFITMPDRACAQPACAQAALEFDNEIVRLPPEVFDGLGDFTIELWVNTPAGYPFLDAHTYLSVASTSLSNQLILERLNSQLIIVLFDNGFSFGSLAADQWYHVAFVRDGSQVTGYVNGTPAASMNMASTVLSVPPNGAWLGQEQDSVAGGWQTTQAYYGLMDEVRVWDFARSEIEIQQDMDNALTGSEPGLVAYWRVDEGVGQVLVDSSGHGHDATLGFDSSPEVWDPEWIPSGVGFTGCNEQYFQIQDPASNVILPQNEPLTISWLDANPVGSQIQLFFDPDTGPTPWDEGAVSNQIALPISLDAADPNNSLMWGLYNLDPGTYSVWGSIDDGVSPTGYSRAPGLITVTAIDVNTEPAVDEDRITLGSEPSPTFFHTSASPSSLYLVTHGWNGLLPNPDHGWIDATAMAVRDHVIGGPAADDWDVASYNWQSRASGAFGGPGLAAWNAWVLGDLLGAQIESLGYTHVEIVAHGAGAWMAHTIAYQLSGTGTDVQLTLLDAYVPPSEESTVPGVHADHVFNFYDRTPNILICPLAPICWLVPTPGTQKNLFHAFNADISCRHSQFSSGIAFTDHSTPRNWYRDSALNADASFIDDAAYTDASPPKPLGFKMSDAYWGPGGGDPGDYPSGETPFILDCGTDSLAGGCAGSTTVYVAHRGAFDLSLLSNGTGVDGSAVVTAGQVQLTTGTETAWISFDLPIDHPISSLLFDVAFESVAPDAEGYLTGYWQGVQMASVDERFLADASIFTREISFYEVIDPGNKIVSFRLDANGGPTSSATVSNVRTGTYIDADVNGDCMITGLDLCTWVDAPTDLDGDGLADTRDQELLADAIGVPDSDSNGNGVPDGCDLATGDVDLNGVIDVQDLLAILATWGPCAAPCQADTNQDGFVDITDLLTVLANWS